MDMPIKPVGRRLSFTSFSLVRGANAFIANDVRANKTDVKGRQSTWFDGTSFSLMLFIFIYYLL